MLLVGAPISRARATYTRVDNGNLDTLARDTVLVELVDLGHEVRRVGGCFVVPLVEASRLGRGLADRVDNRPRDLVELHRPHVLDRGRRGNRVGLGFGIFNVVELDRDALEQLVVELHTRRAFTADLGVEVGRVLLLHSIVSGNSCLSIETENPHVHPQTQRCRRQERGLGSVCHGSWPPRQRGPAQGAQ